MVLILTRKIGESLIIQDNIRVMVLGLRGKQVRLGIEAPEDVVILREEIFHRVAQENREAAGFQWLDLETLASAALEVIKPRVLPPPLEPLPAILVESQHLGPVRVREDLIFTFPGLPGFPDHRRFALLDHPQVAPFWWLQSLETPGLALVVAAAESLEVDYQGSALAALKDLSEASLEDWLVLVILTVPTGRPLEATANLKGPLLLNLKTHRGRQVILENSQYPQKHRVLPLPGE